MLRNTNVFSIQIDNNVYIIIINTLKCIIYLFNIYMYRYVRLKINIYRKTGHMCTFEVVLHNVYTR